MFAAVGYHVPVSLAHRGVDRVARGARHHAGQLEPEAAFLKAAVRAQDRKQRRVGDDLHLALALGGRVDVRVVDVFLHHVAFVLVHPPPERIEGLVREEQQHLRLPRLHDEVGGGGGQDRREEAECLEVGDAEAGRARLDRVIEALTHDFDVAVERGPVSSPIGRAWRNLTGELEPLRRALEPEILPRRGAAHVRLRGRDEDRRHDRIDAQVPEVDKVRVDDDVGDGARIRELKDDDRVDRVDAREELAKVQEAAAASVRDDAVARRAVRVR